MNELQLLSPIIVSKGLLFRFVVLLIFSGGGLVIRAPKLSASEYIGGGAYLALIFVLTVAGGHRPSLFYSYFALCTAAGTTFLLLGSLYYRRFRGEKQVNVTKAVRIGRLALLLESFPLLLSCFLLNCMISMHQSREIMPLTVIAIGFGIILYVTGSKTRLFEPVRNV